MARVMYHHQKELDSNAGFSQNCPNTTVLSEHWITGGVGHLTLFYKYSSYLVNLHLSNDPTGILGPIFSNQGLKNIWHSALELSMKDSYLL